MCPGAQQYVLYMCPGVQQCAEHRYQVIQQRLQASWCKLLCTGVLVYKCAHCTCVLVHNRMLMCADVQQCTQVSWYTAVGAGKHGQGSKTDPRIGPYP